MTADKKKITPELLNKVEALYQKQKLKKLRKEHVGEKRKAKAMNEKQRVEAEDIPMKEDNEETASLRKEYYNPETGEIESFEGASSWATHDSVMYRHHVPFKGKITNRLSPGLYEIGADLSGIFFSKTELDSDNLFHFPDTAMEKVVSEVSDFWKKEEVFKEFGVRYKRGVLLHGPPGTGKTCTIQLVMENIINEYQGVIFRFCGVELLEAGVDIFRGIQPDTPLIILMEDVDSILSGRGNNQSQVLNMLDGVSSFHKCLFLATTNYLEQLGPRISNRPSRFDRRIEIGFPEEETRRLYLESILGEEKIEKYGVDIDRWAADTPGLSFAHLKELVISTLVLDNSYEETLERMMGMRHIPSSQKDAAIAGALGELMSGALMQKIARGGPVPSMPGQIEVRVESRPERQPSEEVVECSVEMEDVGCEAEAPTMSMSQTGLSSSSEAAQCDSAG